MAKKKPSLMAQMRTSAIESGIQCNNLSDQRYACRVIACPSIAWQYLTQANGVFASRLVTMHGLKKTGKSTLAQSIGGWVIRAGGMANIYDTENKLSPVVMEAAFYKANEDVYTRKEVSESVMVYATKTMEEWQRMLALNSNQYIEYYGKTGPRCQPLVNIVDSLLGANRGEMSASIMAGEAQGKDRSGQVTAMQMFKYLRSATSFSSPDSGQTIQKYPTWPIMTIGICHADTPDEYGNADVKGGEGIKFYTSTHLKLRRAPVAEIINPYNAPSKKTCEFDTSWDKTVTYADGTKGTERKHYIGRLIQVAIDFSGMCDDTKGQSINVPLRAFQMEDAEGSGRMISTSAFDWFTADAIFLEKMAARITKVLTLDCVYSAGRGRCYWAPELKELGYKVGFSNKTKLLADEFGQLIQNNKFIMEELQNVFNIPRYDYYGNPPLYKYTKFADGRPDDWTQEAEDAKKNEEAVALLQGALDEPVGQTDDAEPDVNASEV